MTATGAERQDADFTEREKTQLKKTKEICLPCAKQLEAEGKVKIGTSKKDKSTCEHCKRRRYVYICEVK